MNSEDTLLLSIVVPAYNEARRLPETLEHIRSHLADQGFGWEAIIVDDGSADDSATVVEGMTARDDRFRLIRNPHAGKGYAVRTGVLEAKGDLVFMADADLSMPISEINKFVPLAQNEIDVVIGSREADGAKRLDEPFYRHLMGRVFNLLVQAMLVPGIKDTQCGFKCFRRPAARAIFQNLRLVQHPERGRGTDGHGIRRGSALSRAQVGTSAKGDPDYLASLADGQRQPSSRYAAHVGRHTEGAPERPGRQVSFPPGGARSW